MHRGLDAVGNAYRSRTKLTQETGNVTNDREPTGSLPAIHTGRPYEIQAQEYYPLEQYEEAESLDPRRLIDALWRRKWWILACTLLGLAVGVIAGRFVVPEYEITASIWLEQEESRSVGPLRGENPLAGEGWSSVLPSNTVIGPVVRDLALYLNPTSVARADSSVFAGFGVRDSVVAGEYRLEVDRQGQYELSLADTTANEIGAVGGAIGDRFGFVWSPPAESFQPNAALEFSVSTLRGSMVNVREKLEVDFDEDAGIIYSTLLWNDPREGAFILNALQDQFISTATNLKNAQLRETVSILEEQTGLSEDRLRSAELSLENYKVATITLPSEGLLAPAGREPGSQSIMTRDPVFDAYFSRKIEQRELQVELETLGRVLQAARTGGDVDVLGLQSLSSAGRYPALQSALEQMNELEAARRSLLLTFTEQQEEVQRLTLELTQLKTRTIPSLITDLISQLQTRLSALDQQLETQTAELRSIPTRSIEQARLERELLGAAVLHENLQARLKEAELAEATSSPGLQVLDAATAPLSPTENPQLQLLLMAGMAGVGIGIAGALLFDKLDKRIRYPEQVSQNLGLRVLGIVPRLDSRQGADAEVAVESFRSIRLQISHSNGTSRSVVLVTSPAPRDGKSMVSANLAISYATAGHKTILVDADVRRGHAHTMFEVERSPGLSDYLVGRVESDVLAQATAVGNLTFIARGAGDGFNPELLDSEAMDRLLAELRNEYEIVVLDAPPLAAGADTLVLGKRSDKVVIVLRAGETDSQLAKTKLDLIGNVNLPIVGAVLNAVPTTSHYYQYYGTYYYADAEPVA